MFEITTMCKQIKMLDNSFFTIKAVEHKSDDCANCDWCFWHNN